MKSKKGLDLSSYMSGTFKNLQNKTKNAVVALVEVEIWLKTCIYELLAALAGVLNFRG